MDKKGADLIRIPIYQSQPTYVTPLRKVKKMDKKGADLIRIPIYQFQPTYVTPLRIHHGSHQQLPQPLPPHQFMIQSQPQPSYLVQHQHQPSSQFPIRPLPLPPTQSLSLSLPPTKCLSSVQFLSPAQKVPLPQFLHKSDSEPQINSLSEPEPQINSLSEPEPEPQINSLSEPEPLINSLSEPEPQTQINSLSEPELEPQINSLSEHEPLINSLSEPEPLITSLSDPESESHEPGTVIKSLNETEHQSLPQPSYLTLPQTSYQIQSLPSSQLLFRPLSLPPAQTQFLQPYRIQSLPSHQFPVKSLPPAQYLPQPSSQFPIRPLPLPPTQSLSLSLHPAKCLSSVQFLSPAQKVPLPQFLHKSDSEPQINSLSEPEPQINSLSEPEPEPQINSLSEPEPLINSLSEPEPQTQINSLSEPELEPQINSLSEHEPLINSLSEPEPLITSLSDPESESHEPGTVIKSLNETEHQSLPQPSYLTLPQTSYQIQSLPSSQLLFRPLSLPPAQTQFLQPYRIQSLPSHQFPVKSLPPAQYLPQPSSQFPIRPLPLPPTQSLSLSLPPTKCLSSVQFLSPAQKVSEPQFLPKSDSEFQINSLFKPEPLINSLSEPEPLSESFSESESEFESFPESEPISESFSESESEFESFSESESLSEPVIKSLSEPKSESLSEPEPVIQSLSEPKSESLSEPEPVIQSLSESLSEPESVIKSLSEPEHQSLPQPSSRTHYLVQTTYQIQPLPLSQFLFRSSSLPPAQTRFLQPSYRIKSVPSHQFLVGPLPPAQYLHQPSSQTRSRRQPSYQTRSLRQPSYQIQSLRQPSYQIQSLSSFQSTRAQFLPPPLPESESKPRIKSFSVPRALIKTQPEFPHPPAKFLIRPLSLPPAQTQSLLQPSYQVQSLPSHQSTAQFPPPPPDKSLSPVQNVPSLQFLPKSDCESLIEPESESKPRIKSFSVPRPLIKSQPESPPLMAQMINTQRNDQDKSHVSRNNSSNSKYKKWLVQSEESLQKQHAVFHKASFGEVLFCCFTLDTEWFFYLEEIGLPVKACRDELNNSLTSEDLDYLLIIEDIFTTLIHLSKDHTYLIKMLDAVEKLEKTVLNDDDYLVAYLLEKAHPIQVVQQTWKEVFVRSDVSEQKKFLTLFLMKLYQQHINDFNNAVDSWEKMRNLSVNGTYVADTLQENGEEQLRNGNLEDALRSFNEAINNCPLDVNSYKKRAKIHEMLKNYKLSSCDLIRVHVLDPDWEEGYIIHEKILKNLDDEWTTFYFKIVEKWTTGAYSNKPPFKTVVEDKFEKENICISSSLKADEKRFEEKNTEEKMSSVWNASDNLLKKAMDLYKQQKFKEMLQLFKANILETTLYQLALLSLIHLKQFDDARQLALTAIQAFTDHRQFSGVKEEITNLKKMFNFVKTLPPSPFGQCEICKTGQQSSVANIYLYDDCSMLDDIFHKGCIVLSCENRCKILFHFECLSGSNDFVWKKSSLKNYLRTLCSTPDCQSSIIMAEAFSVNNTKTIKVVDNAIGFKRPEINNQTEISRMNLTVQNPKEQNNNIIGILASSDEATLPSDNSEGSAQDLGFSSQQAQAAMANEKKETKSLPSYKEYEKKKTGKNKKRAEKKTSLTENMEFGQGDISLNPNLTNGLQPETNKKEELKQSFSESAEEIEKDHLLLYLCSVLHAHGQLSASGEIFQNEIKALSDNHKKLLSKSGGLASFLLQSNNVLLKDPDILFLEADTLTTVIPTTEDPPLSSSLPQASATGEDITSSTLPTHSLCNEMSATGNDTEEQRNATSGRGNQLKRSAGNSDFEFALRAAFGPEFGAERLKVQGIPPENASSRENRLNRSDLSKVFEMGNTISEDEFEISKQIAFQREIEDHAQNLLGRNPNGASASAGECSKNPRGSPKLDSEEEFQSQNSPPDKEGMNILDLSTSEFDTSSSSSEQEQPTEEDNDFFSYSDEHSTTGSSDSEFCVFCTRKCKPRIAYLEEENRKLSVLYNNKRRHHEMAEKKVSSLEAKLKALEEENEILKKVLEDGPGAGAAAAQSSEASNAAAAVIPKSILRTGRRSLPSHLKSSKQSSQPPPKKEEEDLNMCVICHEDIFLLTINTLQCGHVFHDKCIRKWFQQQKTCPSCRKHTLLNEEFPPLA